MKSMSGVGERSVNDAFWGSMGQQSLALVPKRMKDSNQSHFTGSMTDGAVSVNLLGTDERETDRQRDRDRVTETETDRQRQGDRERETDRERDGERD